MNWLNLALSVLKGIATVAKKVSSAITSAVQGKRNKDLADTQAIDARVQAEAAADAAKGGHDPQ